MANCCRPPGAQPPQPIPADQRPDVEWRVQAVHHLCQRAASSGIPGQLQRVLRAKNNNGATALVTAGNFGQPAVLQALLQYYCSYEEVYGEQASSNSGALQLWLCTMLHAVSGCIAAPIGAVSRAAAFALSTWLPLPS
jgi:hypothetical protein